MIGNEWQRVTTFAVRVFPLPIITLLLITYYSKLL